jgi:hypothetical protein
MNKTVNTVAPVLTASLLRQAAELAELIQTKQNELNALLAGKALVATAPKTGKSGKRVLSPEAVAAIQRGQAKRWAKVRKAAKLAAATPPVVVTVPPNGTLEPATGFETPPIPATE